MIDLNEMSEKALEVSNKRIQNGAHMTGDALKHAAEELVEAAEARAFYTYCLTTASDYLVQATENYEDELADVITCVLIAAAECNLDIEQALQRVAKKNKARAEKQGDKL